MFFGELFARGYVNGIVDEATRAGLTVVRATVGRRDEEGRLRKLTESELESQPRPFINVPLEAGFDLEPSAAGPSPVDQLKGIKLSAWQESRIDWQMVASSRERATERFRENTAAFLHELEPLIPKGANVLFLHTDGWWSAACEDYHAAHEPRV